MTTTIPVWGGVLALSLALPGALEAQKADSTFRWAGSIAAGRTLTVKGINGSVTATGAKGNASVRAIKRTRKGDLSAVEIRVVEDGDGVILCAVYPKASGTGCQLRHNGSDDDDRGEVTVDFIVEVPSGVRFEGSTVNGDVDAGGLTADAEVTSVNGDVALATSGIGSATTVNGSVKLSLGKASWDGTIEATTVNGRVVVVMPQPTDLTIRASMLNGDFESDFPITIQGKTSRQSVKGTIGKGGPELKLQTVNGGIALRKAS